MINLIDTHAHIYKEYYSSKKYIIDKSFELGVTKIITAGTNNNTNKEVIKTCKEFNNVYGVIGIHPEDIDSFNDNDLDFIKDNLNNPKIIGIGEIGLDYHFEGYNKNEQIELLEKQLLIAQNYNMPVVIHCRDAHHDLIPILKNYKLKGVIHSFSGSFEIAKEYIKLGYKLGINGVVTFKNAKVKEVIKSLGLEHFVLETDSPYLTPEPYRGTQNLSANVYYIALFIANYLKKDIEEVEKITNNNIRSIFDKLIF